MALVTGALCIDDDKVQETTTALVWHEEASKHRIAVLILARSSGLGSLRILTMPQRAR